MDPPEAVPSYTQPVVQVCSLAIPVTVMINFADLAPVPKEQLGLASIPACLCNIESSAVTACDMSIVCVDPRTCLPTTLPNFAIQESFTRAHAISPTAALTVLPESSPIKPASPHTPSLMPEQQADPVTLPHAIQALPRQTSPSSNKPEEASTQLSCLPVESLTQCHVKVLTTL